MLIIVTFYDRLHVNRAVVAASVHCTNIIHLLINKNVLVVWRLGRSAGCVFGLGYFCRSICTIAFFIQLL